MEPVVTASGDRDSTFFSNGFIGRDNLLKELALKLDGVGRHSRVALFGLGGVGCLPSFLPFDFHPAR
jgi:hypothetical protein